MNKFILPYMLISSALSLHADFNETSTVNLSEKSSGQDDSGSMLALASKQELSHICRDDQTFMKGAFKVEAGISYFYPQSSVLREIYTGGVNYHATLSQKLSRHWDVWMGVNYFNKDGHSINGHQKTNIRIFPVSLGLKRLFKFHVSWTDIIFYVNGGFKYYFVNIHDHSDFVRKHTSKNGLGGVFGAGTYFYFTQHWYVNALIDYSFKRFHGLPHKHNTRSHTLDVGGWDFGAGIGVSF